ncbi:hypothetical protein DCS32_15790 [Dokdonia sp. Dokd-P16]|uniref:hypothetical protein n=1 Tax=Dokdonia sp. Dokd-P16 TaxID=2173169 RepID=UPI000D547F4A|nr:hypothetical protein [Dokdonia sp. Dokd-P16]AWH75570.1 hypothetical protein DCS32_15790 [Dokdonia sp. Dokd-P16]
MNSVISIQDTYQLAQIAFEKPSYTERDLMGLFHKSAHKKADQTVFDTWVRDTEKRIYSLQNDSKGASSACSTVSLTIAARLHMYIRVITRFEQQFMMSCPCAATSASPILNRLKKISQSAQVALLYVEV